MLIKDVGEQEFMAQVVERSREVPVVVDFWASWCGPCRQLGPALEAAVTKRDGGVELAKVDVDSNQNLAASFGVQGIPAVKAFRDGQVVAEFTGALPPAQIETFLDGLVPSPIDGLVATGDEASLRQALALDPRHGAAAAALGRMLIARGDAVDAIDLLDPLRGDFVAEGLIARAQLTADGGDVTPPLPLAFVSWDDGDHAVALETLQSAYIEEEDHDRRDLIRRVMIAIFTELGADHQLAREHRRRLSAALS